MIYQINSGKELLIGMFSLAGIVAVSPLIMLSLLKLYSIYTTLNVTY